MTTHEGALDPSPRALRIMAAVRWLLLFLVTGVAALSWWRLGPQRGEVVVTEAAYHCPMHPQIRSHEPGSCPICSMSLEPIDAEPTESPGGIAGSAAPLGGEALAPVMLSPARRQLASIVVLPVERRAVAQELRLAAVLEVPRSATTEVRVRVPAFLEAVAPVEVGQRVRAGQTLVWATAPELARGVEELRVARAAKGLGDEASSILADATRRKLGLLGVSSAQADALSRAEAPAGSLAIGAPVSGVVTARSAVRGGYAGPEDALFTITSFDTLIAQATVRAGDLAALDGATRGLLRVGPLEREVSLDWVEPFVDPATRTATLRFSVANADGALRPGASGQVVVPTRERPRLVVPRDAVVETGRATYVYVERDEGYFEPRPVVAGAYLDDLREILEGVAVGERVVVRGVFVLDSESRLKGAVLPARPDDGGAARVPAPEGR
jgi:hypothetical protein